MRIEYFLVTLLISLSPVLEAQQFDAAEFAGNVFHLEASGCESAPESRSQTAFRLRNRPGLYTSLHGVVGCSHITARQSGNLSPPQRSLRITELDVEHDVAYLEGESSVSKYEGLRGGDYREYSATDIWVLGHPSNVPGLHEMRLSVPSLSVRLLADLAPPSVFLPLQSRSSPSVGVNVLSLNGDLQPGHSGAPLLASDGSVVGIANGGLAGGTLGIGWGVLLSDVNLQHPSQGAIQHLSRRSPALVFSYKEDLNQSNRDQALIDTLLEAQEACSEGKLRIATKLYGEAQIMFPKDQGIAELYEKCKTDIEETRFRQFTYLVSSGTFLHRHRKDTFIGYFDLEVDGKYCGEVANYEDVESVTCEVKSGVQPYGISNLAVFEVITSKYNTKEIMHGGSCGGHFRAYPQVDSYGIVLCLKKPNISCEVLPIEEAYEYEYSDCTF